jgi:hypothetical protein
MRKRWLIHGMVVCTALIASTPALRAQGGGGGGGGGGAVGGSGLSTNTGTSSTTAGSTSGTSSSSSLGSTTSGQSGAITSLTPTTAGSTSGNGGGGAGGGAGGRGAAASTAATAVPAATDPFITTYNSPLIIGINGVSESYSSNSTGGVAQVGPSLGFGVPTWTAATATNSATTVKNTTGTNGEGFDTTAVPKTPAYMTVLSKSVPYVQHNSSKLQETLLSTLASVPFLQGKKGVFLAVDGSTVFLKGEVEDEAKRRVLEGVVRMTPGVRNVVNELVALNKKQ